MSTTSMPDDVGNQKRVAIPLGLEAQVVLCHHMGAGSAEPKYSGRVTNALNC